MGRFITSTIVITGFALPLILAHSEIIHPAACVMSIIGGGYVRFLYDTKIGHSLVSFPSLVYGTILAYSAAFRDDSGDF